MAKSNEELKKEVEGLKNQLSAKDKELTGVKKSHQMLADKTKDFDTMKAKLKTDEDQIKNLMSENKNLAKSSVKQSENTVLPGNGKDNVKSRVLVAKTNMKGGRLQHEVYKLFTKDTDNIMMTVVYRDGNVDDTYFQPMPK